MQEHGTPAEAVLTAHAGLHMLCHASHDPVAVVSLPHGTLLEVNQAFRNRFSVPDPIPTELSIADFGSESLARALQTWDGDRPRLLKTSLSGHAGRIRLLGIPGTFPTQAFLHFIPRRPSRAQHDQLKTLLDEKLAQIRNFERLRSLGEVAAMIIHELRTPLTSIRVAVEGVRKAAQTDPSLYRRLDVALEQVDRLDRLLSGIRNFSRPCTLAVSRVDVREVLSAALRAVEGLIQGPATTVTVEVKPDPFFITVDAERLVEVMINLVVNAIDAMPEGGLVRIKAHPSARRKRWIELSVTDSGQGIPAHLLPKLWHPFFTTKPTGTGLGLAIVKKLVELHGGFVTLKSVEGKGTVVTLELPCES